MTSRVEPPVNEPDQDVDQSTETILTMDRTAEEDPGTASEQAAGRKTTTGRGRGRMRKVGPALRVIILLGASLAIITTGRDLITAGLFTDGNRTVSDEYRGRTPNELAQATNRDLASVTSMQVVISGKAVTTGTPAKMTFVGERGGPTSVTVESDQLRMEIRQNSDGLFVRGPGVFGVRPGELPAGLEEQWIVLPPETAREQNPLGEISLGGFVQELRLPAVYGGTVERGEIDGVPVAGFPDRIGTFWVTTDDPVRPVLLEVNDREIIPFFGDADPENPMRVGGVTEVEMRFDRLNEPIDVATPKNAKTFEELAALSPPFP